MVTSKTDGIFFDLDNTLFDYEAAFKQASLFSYQSIEKMLPDKQKPESWFIEFKKQCDDYWPLYEKGLLHRQAYQKIRFIRSLREEKLAPIEKIAEIFHETMETYIPPEITLFPHIPWIIQLAEENRIPWGIITNGASWKQRGKIQKLGLSLSDLWLFISEECEYAKPDPMFFRYVQQKTECSNPLYIGDSLKMDILPAISAGWKAIWYNLSRSKPVMTFDDFEVFDTPEKCKEIFIRALR